MKPLLRWFLLLPAILLGAAIAWQVYKLGIGLALYECPSNLQNAFSSYLGRFSVIKDSDNFCGASWFPTTNRVLFVAAQWLSAATAGVIGFRLSPSHKRVAAVLASFLAIELAVFLF